MRLASLLFASLEKRFRRLRGEFKTENFRGSSPNGLAIGLCNLIAESIDEPFVIIMDEIHLLNSEPSAIEFLDSLILNLPNQVTVFSSGREVPEVSLAKLMAEGDLSGIGPHDLALNLEETRAVVSTYSDRVLTDHEISTLHEQARGWITGLLLSQTISSGPLQGPWQNELGMVHEYLASVVLNRLPDHIRRFMLDASILPIMSEEICNEVLGISNSSEILEELLKTGVFLFTASVPERMYEFHPLFRQFLVQTLEASDPERLQQVRRKAAQEIKEDFPLYAFELLIQLGDKDEAIEFASKHAPSLFKHGQFTTIQTWDQALHRIGGKSVVTKLYLARSLADIGNIEAAMTEVENLIDHLSEGDPHFLESILLRALLSYLGGNFSLACKQVENIKSHVQLEELPIHLVGLWHRLLALLAHVKEIDYCDPVEEIQASIAAYRESGDLYYSAAALQDLVLIQGSRGNLLDARIAAEEALEIHEEFGASLPIARSYNDLAMFDYLGGEFHRALSNFNKGRKRAADAASEVIEATIIYGIADLFSDCGLFIQAASMYEEALLIGSRRNLLALSVYGCLRTSVLHRRAGNLRLAVEWLQRAQELQADRQTPSLDAVTQKIAIELGSNPSGAEKEAERLLNDLSTQDSDNRVRTLAYKAQALILQGEEEKAKRTLEEGILYANSTGKVQVFASELRFLEDAQHLLKANPLHGEAEVLQRLEVMDLFNHEYKEVVDDTPPTEKLTILAMGTMEVSVDGNLIEIKPQALEVFFYILDNTSIERDILIEEFWNGHPPGRQNANLHMAIYSIRQSIGKDAIDLDGTRYSISRDLEYSYDVDAFQRAARVAENLVDGDPRLFFALTEAINAYKGEFLPNLYSDWVEKRRRQIELRYLDLIVRHAEEALIQNQPNKSIQILRTALEIDPYRDDLNLQYLEVLRRLGRRAEILSHYRRYSELLRNELGLQPSTEIKRVHDLILKA
jgi:ATP/maltotriose-dependent transcriptional regulator MalT/DNA-binding SARP family transcriptional activator